MSVGLLFPLFFVVVFVRFVVVVVVLPRGTVFETGKEHLSFRKLLANFLNLETV